MITKYCQIITQFETNTNLHKETNASQNRIGSMSFDKLIAIQNIHITSYII